MRSASNDEPQQPIRVQFGRRVTAQQVVDALHKAHERFVAYKAAQAEAEKPPADDAAAAAGRAATTPRHH